MALSFWFDLVRFGAICRGFSNRQRTEKCKRVKKIENYGKRQETADPPSSDFGATRRGLRLEVRGQREEIRWKRSRDLSKGV